VKSVSATPQSVDVAKETPIKDEVAQAAKTPQPKVQSTQPKVQSAQSQGRAFVVQIMASATQLSLDDTRFGKQRGKVSQYTAEGAYRYKYCVGRYADRQEAQRAAMALRNEFGGAFVVEVDGSRVVTR
jgi:N-acetylmuramoyl-L-alanine amidase